MSHTREKSKYKGVEWDEPNNKWVARYRGQHLGLFDEEGDAANAIFLKQNKEVGTALPDAIGIGYNKQYTKELDKINKRRMV